MNPLNPLDRWFVTLREEKRTRRIAQALWVIWAFLVWNVVFDHVIVVAGREYITAASLAARGGGPYARMDDWMRPAITRGVWTASAAAGAILLVGVMAIQVAARRGRSGR